MYSPIIPSSSLPPGHDLVRYILRWWGHSHDFVNVYSIPDTLVFYCFLATFLFIAIHPKRFKILRRMLVVFGIMNLLRAFTVSVTQLPDAAPICQSQFTDPVTGEYKRLPMFPKAFK